MIEEQKEGGTHGKEHVEAYISHGNFLGVLVGIICNRRGGVKEVGLQMKNVGITVLDVPATQAAPIQLLFQNF